MSDDDALIEHGLFGESRPIPTKPKPKPRAKRKPTPYGDYSNVPPGSLGGTRDWEAEEADRKRRAEAGGEEDQHFDHDMLGVSFTALPQWEVHGVMDAFEGTSLRMVSVDGPKGMEFSIYAITAHNDEGYPVMFLTCCRSIVATAREQLKNVRVTEFKNSELWADA